jgi:hypothetical protein
VLSLARTVTSLLVEEYCVSRLSCVAGALVCLADSTLLQDKEGKCFRRRHII